MNVVQWRWFFVVSQSLAIGLTVWRILYRRWRWYTWWDDVASGVASLGSAVMLAQLLMSLHPTSPRTENVLYWVIMDMKTLTMWATRISIILSIARLYKILYKSTRFVVMVAYLLLATGLSSSAITNYMFAMDLSWLSIPDSRCPTSRSLVIAIFTVESFIDLALTLSPIYITKNLKNTLQRSIMFISYSCSMWIFAVNTAFTVASLHQPLLSRTTIIWLANLTVVVCVLLCNLGVVAACLYRAFPRIMATYDDIEVNVDLTDLSLNATSDYSD